MSSLRTVLFLFAIAGFPAAARAQDEAPIPQPPPMVQAPPSVVDPTAHRHLGFFFHLDLGAGYFYSSAGTGTTLSISGPAAPLGIAIGGAVSENWILSGETWGSIAPNPRVGYGGTSSSADNTSVSLEAIGLGVTHYFMPANVYLTVTPALTVLTFRSQNDSSSTNYGFGAKLAVGKEWWVGDHWGLGVGVHLMLGVNKDQGEGSPTWTTFGGGVTFSVTYN